MFQNLINFDPEVESSPPPMQELEDAAPADVVNAQATTGDWLTTLGADSDEGIEAEIGRRHAREAFTALATTTADDDQRAALLTLKTPAAVRHLTGMLTAYDWEFVEQAKELRGYTVAQIVELTKSGNENVRLKALQLLGKVTEIGLFTDKVEVTKKDLTDAELESRIKEKINRFMGVVDVVEVEDATAKTHDTE